MDKCPCENCICIPICGNKDMIRIIDDCSNLREYLRFRKNYKDNFHKCVHIFCKILNVWFSDAPHYTTFKGYLWGRLNRE